MKDDGESREWWADGALGTSEKRCIGESRGPKMLCIADEKKT